MCVGTCARILGPCLLTLGLLSILANILLLFPSWEWQYLKMGHITKKAVIMPGVWGGGLMVLPAAVQITAVGWRQRSSCSFGTCQKMFLSIVLSVLALLGSTTCFILSGVGVTDGPLCLYNVTRDDMKMQSWGYPFPKMSHQALKSGTRNYLYEPSLWNSVCIEPPNVVTWNIYFFFALLIINMVEMVLASLLIINGFVGCLCGSCDKK
ncbi:transmembrane 4 L6 family member 19 [Hemicordylus capensis]|uniref:transmembrane 4 L6 family member 19 n=1 Tax=Hemicordylus capensis TaxID=884348 RepID=UPI002304BDAE|nr:transmembrane 4 L6 family member 19 [Hemicordylus capensis]